MKRRFIFLALSQMVTSLSQADFSLFINEKIEEGREIKKEEEFPQNVLSGILYRDSEHWTLWFKGDVVIHAEDEFSSFQGLTIKKVSAEKIVCLYLPSQGQRPKTINLFPASFSLRKLNESQQ